MDQVSSQIHLVAAEICASLTDVSDEGTSSEETVDASFLHLRKILGGL